jgi:3-isopropylmalate dehydrogenase
METQIPLAVFPGDGHGPEVIRSAMRVLDAAGEAFGFGFDYSEFPCSGAQYMATGELRPNEVLARLESFPAILFGGVGHVRAPVGLLNREILLRITEHLDLYISLRPVRLMPGVKSYLRSKGPREIDYVIVRETSGGMNGKLGGSILKNTPDEIAQESMIYSRRQVERCLRFAFELAGQPGRRGQLTLSGKSSLLRHVYELWHRVFEEMGRAEYPKIRRQYYGIDDICMQLVRDPETFDVIVTGNLFGDILADVGAVSQGGIAYASVGSIHPGKTGMFGPMRASPDFYEVSANQANPMAAIGAAAMLLRHIGQAAAAARVEEAMMMTTATEVIGEGAMLSRFSTVEVGEMVANRVL